VEGHTDLIEAFDKLEQANASLIIVGDGPQMETLKGIATKTKYAMNIHFLETKMMSFHIFKR